MYNGICFIERINVLNQYWLTLLPHFSLPTYVIICCFLGKRININNKKNAHTAHCFLYKRFQVLLRHIPCNSFTWANWHFAFFNMNILTSSPDIRFYSEKLGAKGLHSWWLGTWLYWTCKKAGSSPTQENIESSKARSFFSVEIPYLQSQFQRCSRL